ncbi:MAG: succinate dehydrogenase, cytochrome b556 subunit [Alphaproteobacteria bacterium]|nr:succinate dehydrogenase, cytochrome b556 subunit [Alphaproteobacteria bacterium]
MNKANRPLSPHLQVYKPQITSVLSITHRATGIALVVGTLVLVWWLVAAAAGPGPFATVQGVLRSWIGQLLLLGWSFALFFHLCCGIRHLFWDAGYGFDIPTVTKSGWTAIAGAVALTAVSWIWAYASLGGAS